MKGPQKLFGQNILLFSANFWVFTVQQKAFTVWISLLSTKLLSTEERKKGKKEALLHNF